MKNIELIHKLVLTTGLMAICFCLSGQVIDPKTVVKEKGTERVNKKIDKGIDSGLKKIEEGVGKLFKKKNKKDNSNELENLEQGEDNMDKDVTSKNPSEENVTAPIKTEQLESYTQYDFIPGEQIILYEDFSQDAIGDFPALWTSNGGGEVKTINIANGHWFHMNIEDAVYCFSKEINFPENFIMEFDIIPNMEYEEFELTLYEDPQNNELATDLYPGERGIHINPNSEYGGGWLTKGYYDDNWLEGSSKRNTVIKEQINHVIIWVQKRRVRIYHSGAKVLDMPTNIPPKINLNRMRFATRSAETQPYISNLKITTAAPDMRSKLLTEGKLISYGIYFDSGKDVVKPESYGSIKEIATVLKENPDIRIKIVGHTDSDGDDAKNLDLSKRRAINVKNYLVQKFNIETGRIETDGMGEGQPIENNNTSEGKAKNRRVEFLKL